MSKASKSFPNQTCKKKIYILLIDNDPGFCENDNRCGVCGENSLLGKGSRGGCHESQERGLGVWCVCACSNTHACEAVREVSNCVHL